MEDDDDVVLISEQRGSARKQMARPSQRSQSPPGSHSTVSCMFQVAECMICLENLKKPTQDVDPAVPPAAGGNQQQQPPRYVPPTFLVALKCGHVFHTQCIEEFRGTEAADHNAGHCPACNEETDMIDENNCLTVILDAPEEWYALQPDQQRSLLARTTRTSTSVSGVSTHQREQTQLRGKTPRDQVFEVQRRYRSKLAAESDEISGAHENLSMKHKRIFQSLGALEGDVDDLLTSLTFTEELRCSFSSEAGEKVEEPSQEKTAKGKKKTAQVSRAQSARVIRVATEPGNDECEVDLQLEKVTVPYWKQFATYAAHCRLRAEAEEVTLAKDCSNYTTQSADFAKQRTELLALIEEKKRQRVQPPPAQREFRSDRGKRMRDLEQPDDTAVPQSRNSSSMLVVLDDDDDDDLLMMLPTHQPGKDRQVSTLEDDNHHHHHHFILLDDEDDEEVPEEEVEVEDEGLILEGVKAAPPKVKVCGICNISAPITPNVPAALIPSDNDHSSPVAFFTFVSCPFAHECCLPCAAAAVSRLWGSWTDHGGDGSIRAQQLHWTHCPICHERLSSVDVETLCANYEPPQQDTQTQTRSQRGCKGRGKSQTTSHKFPLWPSTADLVRLLEGYRSKELQDALGTFAQCPTPHCSGVVDVQAALDHVEEEKEKRRAPETAGAGTKDAGGLHSSWIHATCPLCKQPFCYVEWDRLSCSTPGRGSKCVTTVQTAVMDLFVTFCSAAANSGRWELIFAPFPPALVVDTPSSSPEILERLLSDLCADRLAGAAAASTLVKKRGRKKPVAKLPRNAVSPSDIGGVLGIIFQKLLQSDQREALAAIAVRKDPSTLQAIRDVIAKLPNMQSMMPSDHSRVFDVQRAIEEAHPQAYLLFAWILLSYNSSVASLPKDLQMPCMGTQHQYLVTTGNPEREREFQHLKETVGHGSSRLAFHGSGTENWHSILHNGLKNVSGSKLQVNGAAFGKGIYLSPEGRVSFGYSGIGADSGKSVRGPGSSFLSTKHHCIAVCEVLDAGLQKSKFHSGGAVWVQPNDKYVMLRFLFVYHGEEKLPPAVANLDLTDTAIKGQFAKALELCGSDDDEEDE